MPLARLSLLFALVFAACQSFGGGGDVGKVIVVASDLDNMPFAGVDANGKAVGRDVEMMEELARRSGYAVEWRRMPFDQLLPSVENGDVDVVCATLGITPERRERVAFSQAYFYTDIAAVVRVGADEPRALAHLKRRRVAAAAGTTSERAVRSRVPGAILVVENKQGLSAIERLSSRAVDAAVMDGPAAAALVRSSQGDLRRIEQPLDREGYALALPKDRVELLTALDHALRELRNNGWLADLDRRHGLRGN